jgi:hypothetical protein
MLAMVKILYYTAFMGKRDRTKLIKAYKNYRTAKKKRNVLDIFHALMPEIIFRTTKLEGESVTRKKVSTLFK